MATILKKRKSGIKKKRGQAKVETSKTHMSAKRKQAIEKAIVFWKSHSIDMSSFKFDREEANAQ